MTKPSQITGTVQTGVELDPDSLSLPKNHNADLIQTTPEQFTAHCRTAILATPWAATIGPEIGSEVDAARDSFMDRTTRGDQNQRDALLTSAFDYYRALPLADEVKRICQEHIERYFKKKSEALRRDLSDLLDSVKDLCPMTAVQLSQHVNQRYGEGALLASHFCREVASTIAGEAIYGSMEDLKDASQMNAALNLGLSKRQLLDRLDDLHELLATELRSERDQTIREICAEIDKGLFVARGHAEPLAELRTVNPRTM